MTNVSLHVKLQCRPRCPMHCHCLNPNPDQARRRPSLPSALLFAIVRDQVSIALHSMEQQENRTGCLGQPKRVAAEVEASVGCSISFAANLRLLS